MPGWRRSGAWTSGSGRGFFDDDDLSLRVAEAGYELAVALDLFVHHFGGRTFVGAGIDAGALLDGNRVKLRRQVGPFRTDRPEGRAAPWSPPAAPAPVPAPAKQPAGPRSA